MHLESAAATLAEIIFCWFWAILMLFSSFSLASAELGVNVGVSANTGIFTAEAEETMGTTGKRGSDRAVGVFGYTSVFLEKTLGQYLFVGVDYSTEDLDSESVETNNEMQIEATEQSEMVIWRKSKDLRFGFLAFYKAICQR